MDKERFLNITQKRIFTVTFYKVDGSVRKMTAVRGGKKFVKGTGKLSEKVVGMWELKEYKHNRRMGLDEQQSGERSFRSVKPETIISLRANGKMYNSEGVEIEEVA